MDFKRALDMANQCEKEFPEKANETPLVLLGQEIRRLHSIENFAFSLTALVEELINKNACKCWKPTCKRCAQEKRLKKLLKERPELEHHAEISKPVEKTSNPDIFMDWPTQPW